MRRGRVVHHRVVMRPAVVDLVHLGGAPEHDGLEVVVPGPLPPRLERGREVVVGRAVAPLADGRGGALEHVDLLGRFGQRRQALDARGTGADQRHRLVLQVLERGLGATAGVGVVPARRVEGVAGEVLHAADGRQLHEVEDAGGQHVPAARDGVAAVGVDQPARLLLTPFGAGHPGVKERVVDQVEVLGHRLEVPADLLAEGVALARDVPDLLEHGHVDVRLDVAHDAGVAVPVPGAADAAGLVDEANAFDAGLAQVGAGGHTGDAAAEDDDVDLVDDGITLGRRREGVVAVLGEVLVVTQVADVRPAGDQPLVALGQVLGPDGLGVVVLGVEWWRRHGEVKGTSRCGDALIVA